jgi:hypothetical protein
MNWLEVVKVIAEVATAVFALALVRATYVLAKVTRRMDEHEMERRRNEELRACISLAESIISPARDSISSMGEVFTSRFVRPYNQLLALSKYIHDADTKRQLEYVSSSLTTSLLEAGNPLLRDDHLSEEVRKLSGRLAQEIIEWQRDLGNFQRGGN